MADVKRIGRYEILGELGRGGMARVYLAKDPNFGREVALKIMLERLHDSESLRRRFYRESRTIAALEHRAIVPVYDFGEEDGRPYLVMRLMTGGSLADQLRQGPLSPAAIQHILDRIGSALDKAHEHGIIHRDLKPANILLDDDGQPYLSDFGIVKSRSSADLTATGSMIGTPAYMSPEQVLGKETVDYRADIYALGALLFEMLTGRQPYESETAMAVAMAQVTEPVPQLREVAPQLPDGYQGIIDRAMAKEPADRYQRAGALAAAFRHPPAVLDGGPGESSDKGERTIIEPYIVTAPDSAGGVTQPDEVPAGDQAATGLPWKIIAPIVLLIITLFGVWMMRDTFFPTAAPAAPTADATLMALDATKTILDQEIEMTRVAQTAAAAARRTVTAEASQTAAILQTQPVSLPATAVPAADEPSPTPTPSPTTTATPSITPNPAFPPPDPVLGSTWIRPKDSMVMVYVPEGSFEMGSTNSEIDQAYSTCLQSMEGCERRWFEDEQPRHRVSLDPFWIDQYEVTNAQFAAFLNEMGNQIQGTTEWLAIDEADAAVEQDGAGGFRAKAGLEDHPVTLITWYAATSYCEWAGGQLPTEAQWEYAAKGPQAYRFPWGDDFSGSGKNFCDGSCPEAWRNLGASDGYPRTAPVGSFADNVSWVGALDMAGNVWEWTGDWYDGSYYSVSPASNPPGPGDGQTKVLRGGSWSSPEHNVRTTHRYALARRSFSKNDHGFRCTR